MPLVTANMSHDEKTEEWSKALVGKTISDESESTATAFSKRELPEKSRVLKPGQITTRELIEDRLNIHVDDQGIVTHVTFG